MDEVIKRGPGRPAKAAQELNEVWPEKSQPRKVKFVQMHDAFTPLQMAPIMSLSTIGAKAMDILEEREKGIYVEVKGRKFVVPFANIAFYELE